MTIPQNNVGNRTGERIQDGVVRGVESGLEPAVRRELEGKVDGEGGQYPASNVPDAISNSLLPGAVAAAVVCSTIALLGRTDSGSAVAPINASSHVIWGERAGQVEELTWRQTLPGLAINAGASLWWAFVFEKLFGKSVDRGGLAAAVTGGAATASLAYLVDYKLVPKRLTPGWEQRLSGRSLAMSLGAMGLGLAAGALLTRRVGDSRQTL